MTAAETLRRAAQHIEDRAAARDQPQGERSMARTVAAFNALTGHQLTERDGWLFMVALKAARSAPRPLGSRTITRTCRPYAALAAESVAPAPAATPCPFQVPEGCTHVAQDADGTWWAYIGRPNPNSETNTWWAVVNNAHRLGSGEPNPNWRGTLAEVGTLPR